METTATTTATRTATTTTTAGRNGITSDYSTFLRMLTTQMQNQDPLNPIDSADYAVQLATFSGVEQQTKTNQLIEQLIGSMDAQGLSKFAGWVGKEARSTGPVAFSGNPIRLELTPDAKADRAVLAVRNARGVVVAREDVAPGSSFHTWQGQGITGDAVPSGQYSFRLESYAGEKLLSDNPTESYARITEVRSGPTGTRLVLAGGVEIAAEDVRALRDGA